MGAKGRKRPTLGEVRELREQLRELRARESMRNATRDELRVRAVRAEAKLELVEHQQRETRKENDALRAELADWRSRPNLEPTAGAAKAEALAEIGRPAPEDPETAPADVDLLSVFDHVEKVEFLGRPAAWPAVPLPRPCVRSDLKVEQIARVCHEANRALCLAIGDTALAPWDAAPGWQRKGCMLGVEFALANPDATPRDQHEAWVSEKLADGWVHGPVKDAQNKTHPCMVPYEQLPERQRLKDVVFQNVVHALAWSPDGLPQG